MQTYLQILGLLLLPLNGFSQESTPAPARERPPFTLGILPLALINPVQQSVSVQADIPLSSRWGVQAGIGWVFNSSSFATYKGETYTGLKLKPTLKYYMKRSDSGNSYISLVYKYNDLYNKNYINLLRQGGQYTEWSLQRKHIVTHGLSLQLGAQEYFGKNKKWMIEPFLGFGLRQIRVAYDALPPDAELLEVERFFSIERTEGLYKLPDLVIGISLGLCL
ncbi:MAG: hypothetical protein IPL27_28700 [Lewinellaceae bacterium]|nr:hypothetical protein [Lewinellaceae bacterium]